MKLTKESAKPERYFIKDVPAGKGFYWDKRAYIKIGVGVLFQTTIKRDHKNTQYAYNTESDRIAMFAPHTSIEGTPFTCEIVIYEE